MRIFYIAAASAAAMVLGGFAAAEEIDTRRMKVVVTLTEMFDERCVDVDIVEAESAKPAASSGKIEFPNVSSWAKGLEALKMYTPYIEDQTRHYHPGVFIENPFGISSPMAEVLYDFDLPKCRDVERNHFANRLEAVHQKLEELRARLKTVIDELRPSEAAS